MEHSHTPAPWTVRHNQADRWIIEGPDYQVAEVVHTELGDDEGIATAEADAYLVAAAPEMLEVLKSIENDDGRIPSTIWDMRNAAIAKAEGRES